MYILRIKHVLILKNELLQKKDENENKLKQRKRLIIKNILLSNFEEYEDFMETPLSPN